MDTLTLFLWELVFLAVSVLPYYAAGTLLAGVLDVYGGGGAFRMRLRAGGPIAVVLAALAGAVIPVCSCGVVPIVTALLAGGVPLAPAVAFLAAGPTMNPATLSMTAGALGTEIAIARLAATLVLSVGTGFLIIVLVKRGWLRIDRDVRPIERTCPCAWKSSSGPRGIGRFVLAWLRGGELFIGFARYLAFGIALGAAIDVLVGPAWVARHLTGPAAVPLAAIAGVPLYVCTCSEIPIALPLMAKGMSQAALVTFLLAGPGVSAFSLALLGSIFRARLLLFYAGMFVVGSMALGWLAGLALAG
jgi:hypothetical protein